MRSATITPSSLPLCASMGPRTTSPTAQTLAALVRQCSSTTTKPRSSTSTPVPSANNPSVKGRRPTATTSLSTCSECSPCASEYTTSTALPETAALDTLAPSLISSPCF